MPPTLTPADARRALLRSAATATVVVGLPLIALAFSVAEWAALSQAFVLKVITVFILGNVFVFLALPAHLPHQRFGPANQVTLVRLGLAALLAGLLGEEAASVGWPIVGAATVAAVLDAVDGWLARATGIAGPFGARFDMESDAFFVLVLALLAWQLGKVGAWIVVAGLLRYLFIGAGRVWHWFDRPLPASMRRKTISVIQIVTLIVCLAPIVSPFASALIAGFGLALLIYSFAADIVCLWYRADERNIGSA
jgi:phosphatidylglycerophosphate synthase